MTGNDTPQASERIARAVAVVTDHAMSPSGCFGIPPGDPGGVWTLPHADAGGQDPADVLAVYLTGAAGRLVTVGDRLTSQVGDWPADEPLPDDAAPASVVRAHYAHVPDAAVADVEAATGWTFLPAFSLPERTWHAEHVGPVLAARNPMVLDATRPTWPGPVTRDGVTLRELRLADAPVMARLWGDDDTTRNLGHRALTWPQVQLYVRGRLADAEGGGYIPLVAQDSSGAVVAEARATLHPRWSVVGATGEFAAGVGFTVLPELRGKGFGTRLMALLVDTCFTELGVHTVRATVFRRSAASARVFEKLGFRRAGVNVATFRDLDGVLLDDLQYAQTRTEWELHA